MISLKDAEYCLHIWAENYGKLYKHISLPSQVCVVAAVLLSLKTNMNLLH